MQEWNFKEKYEIIETLLKEINQGRKNFRGGKIFKSVPMIKNF